MENKHFVFVYGTLKSDGHNNLLLSENGAQLISSKAWTTEGYCLVTDGCLPYLVEMESFEGEVFGELWLVNDSCLEKLDRLEGHPNWYERKDIRVHVDEKLSYACKAYILPVDSLPKYKPIESGVWKNRGYNPGLEPHRSNCDSCKGTGWGASAETSSTDGQCSVCHQEYFEELYGRFL